RLGLIAGNGKFPILFAREARSLNYEIIAAGVKGDTSILLKPFVSKLSIFRVGELKKLFAYFKTENVRKVIMAGQVNPDHLFRDTQGEDEEFRQLFDAIKDRKADTIFSAVADKLREHDIELIDSTFLIKDHLAPKGTLTRRAPTLSELDDIAFGCDIAKAMGGMDVGQTVVIKDKAIVAIEAMEGTDRTILRGGQIAKSGAVVVKMSKPDQDLRFDVPVIGPRTIQHLRRSRCACLAIEAGKTIIIDQDKTLRTADKAHICIVAV
ncbi:MAG: UDP-2,3-diacylglucosamine diphosphatase LpxI, partial [Candidatus Omnitrophica bacterium]|nr:UDP-2,3-diacylglucosamine diphosphatase LpxI [Candidatus Omnitrophota bacterium]